MIKCLIFDLDSCLSAADEPGTELYEPVFEAIRRSNNGLISPEVLDHAFSDMWRIPFDAVAKSYGFTSDMRDAGWRHLKDMEVLTPMRGYGDLDALMDLNEQRFLVTLGFRRLQESKIRALGISHLFSGIYINAIDELGHRGKQAIFEDILGTYGYSPAEVMIVGDNADSEIAAGIRLGIATVQTLRPGVPFAPTATHHIRTLHELKALLT